MASTIKKGASTVWLLVKVPKITDLGTGSDQTANSLRKTVRDDHFGGEKAAVRRLTQKEIDAIRFVRDSRARGVCQDEVTHERLDG